jgi:hypothetical protein
MDIPTIRASIAAWGAISHNGSAMVSQFAQGNSFIINMPVYAASSPYMHVYLGIYQGQLTFFVIPSNFDTAQYSGTINNYVTVCDAIWTLQGGTDRITAAQAHLRMDTWQQHYGTWVPAQAATTNGVFRAFSIPMGDFEAPTCNLVLGLKVNASATMGYDPDMIVINPMATTTYYDDFVEPVPPFSATALSSSFYLF